MKPFRWLVLILMTWSLWSIRAYAATGGLAAVKLRCEYLVNPLGIGSTRPRLSWELKSLDVNQRGQKQRAYQLLVATQPEKLLSHEGDLWDSGKKVSSQTIQIEYNGKPLASQAQCFWKVRVWDQDGKASAWSEPAFWTTGLLHRQDWGAQWIGDANATVSSKAEEEAAALLNFGYHSKSVTTADTEKWIVLDLGQEQRIDSVKLYPTVLPTAYPTASSFYFPRRFKVEVAKAADFSDARVVLDRSKEDVPDPHYEPQLYKLGPASARYLRLTVTGLRVFRPEFAIFALSEIEVLSNGINLTRSARVSASDSDEGRGWSKDKLIDGITKTVIPPPLVQPAAYLRKDFSLGGEIAQAVLYVSARGVYEIHLNGQRVGDHVLAPEWTSYHHRIQYQTFDVTRQVRNGQNAIGAILGAGWYSGRIGLVSRRRVYGDYPQLILRLEAKLKNGQTVSLVSNESWQKALEFPLESSDILDGEFYDARKEMNGWDSVGFDSKNWIAVETAPELGAAELVAQPNEAIRVVKEITPIRSTQLNPGAAIFDLGQNIVGWCRLKVHGNPGDQITVRYAEMLGDNGGIYTANLRGAPATDHFVLRGEGEETLEPHFTYHGFRYVEVSGLSYSPSVESVLGRVFYSSAPETGSFETSSPLFNQLMQNIVWTQRANLESIPTDCPQRDERLGWMGDIQAFSQTAIFNMDMAAFFTKWLQDVRDDQEPDGRFPDFAPNPFTAIGKEYGFGGIGTPAWADAGTIVPWRAYLNYGDTRLLAVHFESAKHWVDFVRSKNPNLLWENARAGDYNDWLNADTLILAGWPLTGGAVPKPVFATAFFAHSADLVSRMATVLGRSEETKQYGQLFEDIKSAFNRAYVSPDGKIEGNTQGGYALALYFDLLPPALRPKAAQLMVEALQPYHGQLSTGIQSTHRFLLELTRNGYNDEAYRLLNLRTFPSWGFMIDNGATTIWERWDGYVKGRGFQDPSMNSFNHWAFGAVGEWMWRNIIGINPVESSPGFEKIVLRPRPGGGLSWAKGSYDSIRGAITSEWKISGSQFEWKMVIPPNTTATVYVPTRDAKSVREGGKPVRASKNVKEAGREEGVVKYAVTSGQYTFTAAY
ncbi:MAG: family 78 glycoside hydrolase catalytic domain [Terriglobia bacterium]